MSREYPERVKIIKRTELTPDIVGLALDAEMDAKPGQFVMLWVPESGERPISVAWKNPLEVAVKRAGKVTDKIFDMREGDGLYVRGPYGRPFELPDHDSTLCLVGGGCGIAPLAFLREEAYGRERRVYLGAKSYKDVFYVEKLDGPIISTEDGTWGFRGLVTDLFDIKKPAEGSYFYVCGPERMMRAVAERASEYTTPDRIYLLTERYMKCGRGLCGSCELDGYRTCVDGPVFSYDQLMNGDFGCRKRDKSGTRIEI